MQMSCNQRFSIYVLSHLNYTVKYGALVWFFYCINAIHLHCFVVYVTLYYMWEGLELRLAIMYVHTGNAHTTCTYVGTYNVCAPVYVKMR